MNRYFMAVVIGGAIGYYYGKRKEENEYIKQDIPHSIFFGILGSSISFYLVLLASLGDFVTITISPQLLENNIVVANK